jgi:alpha-maltose-1-phosphate synthase
MRIVQTVFGTGAEDLFTNGNEGFIVGSRDTGALISKMQQIADDTNLRQRMREASLKRVTVLGGWRDYGDRWEQLLRTLVTGL